MNGKFEEVDEVEEAGSNEEVIFEEELLDEGEDVDLDHVFPSDEEKEIEK